MLRVLVMDAEKQELVVKEIEDELDEFYRIIGNDCRSIDIPSRKVGSKYFDIIVDDEGLLKANPVCTAINAGTGEDMLFGTLIFTNTDDEGRTVSLTDEDIRIISNELALGLNMITLEPMKVIKMEY